MNELEKADKAKKFIEDPFIQEIFHDMEVQILNRWKNSQVDDTKELMKCKLLLATLIDFKRQFEQAVKAGKVAMEKKSLLERLKH